MRPRLLPRSLVGRLATVVVLVGIVVGGAGVLVARALVQDTLRDDAEAQRRGFADRLATVFDARIDGLGESLRLLSTRADLAALAPDTAELAVALRATDAFDSIALYDASGAPLASTAASQVLEPVELEPRPALLEDLEPGAVVVTPRMTGFPSVDVAVPVENPPGTVVGALVGRASLELVAQGLQARFLGDTARVFVVSGDGTLLVHPQRDRVLDGERFPLDQVLRSGERVASVEDDGVTVLAAAAPVGDLDGFVVVEQEVSEALAEVDDRVTELTLLALLMLVVVVVALIVVAERSLSPLAGLSRTVQRLGSGDRAARAEPKGPEEIRAVAHEVNHMADALDLRMQELLAAQEDLAAAEIRFRTAFEQAPVAMALTEADGTYLQVNPAFCRLLSRNENDVVGRNWRELTHPEDRGESERILDAALRSGDRAYQIEKRYLRSDGEPVWVLLSVAVVRSVEGDAFIAHLQDLTALRAAQEATSALEQMEMRQRQAMELNDNIVQGLTVAKWACEREEIEDAKVAVERTLTAAQELIQRMLREASAMDIQPGDLVRQRPADLERP